VIKILIEAEEEVSKVAKKAEDALNKMGNVGEKVMNGINTASSKVHSTFDKLSSYVEKAREKFNQFTNSSGKLSSLRAGISNAANSFGKLITNSNTAKLAMEKIKSVADGVKAKFTSLQGRIRNVGSSIDSLKTKLKSLTAEAQKTGTGFGFLRNALSMTVGMLGYDLVNSIMQTTRASMNARSSIQAFASRLNMSATEVNTFQKSLDDLQNTYKKIDMDVVGQQATDMAYRLGIPKSALTELTETTAIFSDAMARNGRSAEDSMLAMSDAMDGEFRRLKEIGISQDDLMNNGWSGDINDKTGLLKAMNKALKEQHYDELAKSVDTLDDAWQVLSITLSNFLESILLPLTPTIVAIVNGLTEAVGGIRTFISQLQSAWSSLPEWAQMAIIIAGVAVAVGLLIAAGGGLEAVLLSLAASFAPVIAAVTAISWPLVAVVAAIGLVIAAIYEVGKAFGWWSDVNTMLAAIGAGLQRMWSAFINHPDVQAAISGIIWGLQELGKFITWAGQQILAFFGISAGSEWDVVRAIIDSVGQAWEVMSGKIKFVIGVLTALYNFAAPIGAAIAEALKPIVCIILGCSPGIVPALRAMYDVFVEVWNAVMSFVGPIIGVIVGLVQGIINAFERFKNGQINLPTLIFTVLSMLWNAYNIILTKIINFVIQFGAKLLQRGIAAGRNFVNGVIQWLSQLPGKAYSRLIQVVSRINSAGAAWVRAVIQKAKEVVNGAYNTLATIPDKINSALSGVKDAITKPFQNAYDTVCGIVDNIKQKVSEGLSEAGKLVGISPAGGEMAAGGETIPTANVNVSKAVGWKHDPNNKITVEETKKIILDLINVPAHIDTATLIKMMEKPEVLKALTSNREFQALDNKTKLEIQKRINRAKGV